MHKVLLQNTFQSSMSMLNAFFGLTDTATGRLASGIAWVSRKSGKDFEGYDFNHSLKRRDHIQYMYSIDPGV